MSLESKCIVLSTGLRSMEDSIFKHVISGNLVKFESDYLFLYNELLFDIIYRYVPNYIRVMYDDAFEEYEAVLKMISQSNKYSIHYVETTFPDQSFYELIGKISLSDKFILVSTSPEFTKLYDKFNFKRIESEEILKVYDFSDDIIYLDPKCCDKLLDMAIVYRQQMVFNKYVFKDPIKGTKSPTRINKCYGYPSYINTCCGDIPLEQMMVSQISKSGYNMIAGDNAFNFAVYYSLDKFIKCTPPSSLPVLPVLTVLPNSDSKRRVAFVMSDGDNVCFLQYRVQNTMRMKRTPYYPLTWTVNPYCANIMYNEVRDIATANSDYLIGLCSIYTDLIPSNLFDSYMEETIQKCNEKDFKVLNIIEGKVSSLLGLTGTRAIDSTMKFLVYNYFSYGLNRESTGNKIYATDVIMVPCDITRFLNKFDSPCISTRDSIVAVNLNMISDIETPFPEMKFLSIIDSMVSKLLEKGVEIVTLDKILEIPKK